MVQKNNLNKKLIIICGPTASGKTELALECAKILNTEIISADSMNVYCGLDVGTVKPNRTEREQVKHHLIDVVSPLNSFSVGDYKEKAEPIIEKLFSENKTPIICGGTGFYVNSLIYNLSYGKSPANLIAREKYFNLVEEKGAEYVYNILLSVDPESAKKIHFNDVKRVVRALEIYESGVKKSELNDLNVPIRDYLAYYIDFDRSTLYDRIDKRVDIMIENGLIEEVSGLVNSGIDISYQCMQGIGYKEVYSYLKNEISLEECINLIKLNTRHYAKRQLTFFKKLPNLIALKPNYSKILAERIVGDLCK
ncbi:MAG: tRNA (adenosine(37)-N6)-dimethylallyltransferase MiaA [Clostridia bacterium]|nr:tRNA (adenosine(37)-N6)-dimethylallyltransferase MiaA [Clostridia bacterium]